MSYRLLALVMLFCIFHPQISWAAFRYVHSQSADPRYPYDNWTTAAHTITEAAAGADPSDVIILWPETHTVSGTIQIPAGLKQKDDSITPTKCIVEFDLEENSHFQNNVSIPFVEIRGVTFRNHRAGDGLAALKLETNKTTDITVDIAYCQFSDNEGNIAPGGRGSAISAITRGRKMTVNIRNSVFDGNTASLYGGAIYAAGQAYSRGLDLNISDSIFSANHADNGSSEGRGGAIFTALGSGTLYLSNVTFQQNEARLRGGALNLWGSHLDIDECTFTENMINSDGSVIGNLGIMGAAINLRNYWDDILLSVEIDDTTFDGNYGLRGDWEGGFDGGAVHFMGSNEEGGAPYAMIDPITITNCTFKNNFGKQGAGIYFGRYTDNIEVRRSKFINNISYSTGGAAYKGGKYSSNKGETAIFEYCLFMGNRAGYTKDLKAGSGNPQGGAVMTRLYPRIFLQNSSFLNNRVKVGHRGDSFYATDEGLEFDISGQSKIINCCFWGAGDAHEIAASERGGESAFSSVSHNAWRSDEFNSIFSPQNVIDLIKNPFRSDDDAHLVVKSPCLDLGTDALYSYEIIDLDGLLVTDSDGRSIDRGIDIGAYEFSDNDNDYMPDWWEIENGFDPLSGDALADFDADGFSNLREYLSLSDPRDGRDLPAIIADVNSDGDIDGRELALLGQILAVGDCSGEDHCLDLFPDGIVNDIDLFLFVEDFGRIADEAVVP